eukprot:gene497-biopygen9162
MRTESMALPMRTESVLAHAHRIRGLAHAHRALPITVLQTLVHPCGSGAQGRATRQPPGCVALRPGHIPPAPKRQVPGGRSRGSGRAAAAIGAAAGAGAGAAPVAGLRQSGIRVLRFRRLPAGRRSGGRSATSTVLKAAQRPVLELRGDVHDVVGVQGTMVSRAQQGAGAPAVPLAPYKACHARTAKRSECVEMHSGSARSHWHSSGFGLIRRRSDAETIRASVRRTRTRRSSSPPAGAAGALLCGRAWELPGAPWYGSLPKNERTASASAPSCSDSRRSPLPIRPNTFTACVTSLVM